jgi:adenylate kinase
MIIVIGVAGVGKSTQCQMLKDSGKYQWLSVGQFLRDTVEEPEKKAAMLAGDILDDTFVLPHLAKKLSELGDNPELVVDGFPRTITQAKWLIELNEQSIINISHILNLTAREELARERLEDRGRNDDTEEAITERFNAYKENILPICRLFADAGLRVVEVNGQQGIESVHQEIIDALGVKNG